MSTCGLPDIYIYILYQSNHLFCYLKILYYAVKELERLVMFTKSYIVKWDKMKEITSNLWSIYNM